MPLSLPAVLLGLSTGLAAAEEPPRPGVPPVMTGHRPSTVGAATTPDAAEASLRRLLDRARATSPSLSALRARLSAAAARVGPAGAPADPMLELRLDNMGLTRWTVGEDSDSMLAVMLRQELAWPGVRHRRRDAAAATVALVEAELVVASRAVLAAVHHAWSELYALDRERSYLADSADLLELLTATAAARYGTGDGDQAPVLRVQLEQAGHLAEIARLGGRRARLLAELRGLGAVAPGGDLPTIAALPAITPPPGDWIATAVARAPEVALARVGVAQAALALDLAELGTRPGLAALAGYGFRGPAFDGGNHELDPALTLGLGVTLPVWRATKQAPAIAAARLELDAARAEVAVAELAVRTEAERLDAGWQRLDTELTIVEQGLVPQSSALLDATRSAYLNSRGDFAAAIEAFEQWLTVRVRRERLAAERFAVRAEIASLTALPDVSDTEATP